jgi:D-alanyl-D-alanine carboxypeptidase/D-alanyl-D-alanine-endopeptidase (penicillin-binding protein 4)
MKVLVLLIISVTAVSSNAQTLLTKLINGIKQLESDMQCKHAVIGLYVVDGKSGSVIFEKNAQAGLAPASCQKIITSAAAFELLGHDYRYTTRFGYSGEIKNRVLEGDMIIQGSGDPTLGSRRWQQTKPEFIFRELFSAINKKFSSINGAVLVENRYWETNPLPGGWVWEDMGNYYGAGAHALNWRENQYDVFLSSSALTGTNTLIVRTEPELFHVTLLNEVRSAAKGSGDNTIIYFPPETGQGTIRGTIPVGETNFKISGSLPDPAQQLAFEFRKLVPGKWDKPVISPADSGSLSGKSTLLYSCQSPPLDSINYWFLNKSVNLYGEALLKTIALEKKGFGSTDTGISAVKNFWQQKGIEPSSINIFDGSGLSPANRVTTHSLVNILQYAKKQAWFPAFYFALPEINGIKMKDGYINGVRSYAGYIKNKSGNEFTFSFIINNFNGSPSVIREKIWKLLDILK